MSFWGTRPERDRRFEDPRIHRIIAIFCGCHRTTEPSRLPGISGSRCLNFRMLLSITSHSPAATDLGYLLHKNPANVHTADLSFGKATVFYSVAREDECAAHLLVEVDPVALVRSRGARQGGWALGQYVNDRPYSASSFLSTAISRCFGTALAGRCAQRPELPAKPQDLTIALPSLPMAGSPDRVLELFRPLGYSVEISRPLLDGHFPEWGEARHGNVTLKIHSPLAEVLRHLFVLIPALDSNKHYWIGPDEIDKLVAKGEGWLADHPQRDRITTRYLKFRHSLINEALDRLNPPPDESDLDDGPSGETQDPDEPEVERRMSLHDQRLDRVTEIIREIQPDSVVDLGCGGGKLLIRLLQKTKVPRLLGVDVDSRSLEIAAKRLRLESLPESRRKRITLVQGALTYRDIRIENHDVATLVEVIEHLEPDRLDALERVIFHHARPGTLIVTTPNREYNTLFETLGANELRHPDHRFEWSRAEFREWAERIVADHGYAVRFEGLGGEHVSHGPPSQIAVFTRIDPGHE